MLKLRRYVAENSRVAPYSLNLDSQIEPHAQIALSAKKTAAFLVQQEVGWAAESVWTLWKRDKTPAPGSGHIACMKHTDCHVYS